MAVFKRYKGKRITSKHKQWKSATWWIEFKCGAHHIFQRSGADTAAGALSEEKQLRVEFDEASRIAGNPRLTFTEFIDDHYLPWSRLKKKSFRDDEGKAELLKHEFSSMQLRQIQPMHIERLKSSLLGQETVRGTFRSGATVNRYFYLLSAIFRLACKRGFVNSNPCKRVDKEKESGAREQYLKGEQERRLLNALTGELEVLRPAILLALGTGMRRMELMRLKVRHINFGLSSVFHRVNGKDEECPPNHLLVERTKNGKSRLIPMNESVRSTLLQLVDDSTNEDFVFSFARNGISCSTLRSSFAAACKNAGIPYGSKTVGGLVWHDLRHTFATRLRAQGINHLEIMDLMGHSSIAMTKRYAHQTPAAAQRAVDSLVQPVAEILDLTDEMRVC